MAFDLKRIPREPGVYLMKEPLAKIPQKVTIRGFASGSKDKKGEIHQLME